MYEQVGDIWASGAYCACWGLVSSCALSRENYQGKLSGILSTNGKNEIVVCDPKKQEILPIEAIAYQAEENFATMNRTARLLAYTPME